ncbi:unspecified product [Leishmania tarentolae]|uniref:Unspecified product n=1 Tax=Leishmania tarentolae TaxID=5689 RepID=A0A640KMW1_LEITA|nr:unspecified product [Leishmania tarentolae]
MLAPLGCRPVCASCRVLRGPRLACRSSVRAMASSTQVLYASSNRHPEVTTGSPAPQDEICTGPPLSLAPGASDSVSIGQRLYSLAQFFTKTRLSSKRDDVEVQRLATEAWDLLQSISEEEVETLPLRDVAEIVVAYNYFGTFWANGLNGPARAARDENAAGQVSSSSSQLGVNDRPHAYPIVERADVASGNSETMLNKVGPAPLEVCEAPVRRASPLDEVLDF